MKKINQLLSAVLILGFTSCSHHTNASSKGNDTTPPVPPITEGLNSMRGQSPDGNVIITKQELDSGRSDDSRNQYQRANLIQLPVDAKFNANVLRITDSTIPEYDHEAFIAPKLYTYGSQDGGRLTPITNKDGSVTLAFNVVLLDGSTMQVLQPKSDGTITDVPDLFAVKYQDELKSVLRDQYQLTNGLAPLPGCPKQLTLVAVGKEFDVTPQDYKTGDFCQLNQPTTVTLNVSSDDARMIMENALESNTVDLRAVYETKVSIPNSKISISFDRSKILSDLKMELGLKLAFVDADVKIAIRKVVENQIMQVRIQGDPINDSRLNDIVMRVSEEFFEQFTPTPDMSQSARGSAAVCMRFSLAKTDESDKLEFNWATETNLMSGQNYITTTKLKSTPDQAMFGDQSFKCSSTSSHACRDALRNWGGEDGNGPAVESGFIVSPGNLVKLEPTYYTTEQRSFGILASVREHNSFCAIPKPVSNCSVSELLSGACAAGCLQTTDHWEDITTYYQGDTTVATYPNPIGQAKVIFDGLIFRFQWTDQASKTVKTLDCNASSFPREGNGQFMSVRLKNMPSCSPFTNIEGETPALYVVNGIHNDETYFQGRRIINWDGTVGENATTQTFKPEIELGLILSIPGYGFESSSSEGEILRQ